MENKKDNQSKENILRDEAIKIQDREYKRMLKRLSVEVAVELDSFYDIESLLEGASDVYNYMYNIGD